MAGQKVVDPQKMMDHAIKGAIMASVEQMLLCGYKLEMIYDVIDKVYAEPDTPPASPREKLPTEKAQKKKKMTEKTARRIPAPRATGTMEQAFKMPGAPRSAGRLAGIIPETAPAQARASSFAGIWGKMQTELPIHLPEKRKRDNEDITGIDAPARKKK